MFFAQASRKKSYARPHVHIRVRATGCSVGFVRESPWLLLLSLHHFRLKPGRRLPPPQHRVPRLLSAQAWEYSSCYQGRLFQYPGHPKLLAGPNSALFAQYCCRAQADGRVDAKIRDMATDVQVVQALQTQMTSNQRKPGGRASGLLIQPDRRADVYGRSNAL